MFLRTLKSRTSPWLRRSSGSSTMPVRGGCRRGCDPHLAPAHEDAPALRARSAPMIARTSSVRPEPTRPARPSSSPAAHAEADVVDHAGLVDVLDAQDLLAQLLPVTARSRFSGATSAEPVMWAIRLGLLRSSVRAGQHDLAVAHDGHPVGDLEDLVQAVGHVDHADAGLGEAAHHPVQLLDLRVRERGARLVEHEQARVRRPGRGRSSPCAGRRRSGCRPGPRGRCPRRRAGRAPRAPWPAGRAGRARRPGASSGSPGPARRSRPPSAWGRRRAPGARTPARARWRGAGLWIWRGLAVDQHLARVGLGRPGQDLDQGALAGAVLADQAARPGRRENAPSAWSQREHAGVALDQPLADDQRRARRARCRHAPLPELAHQDGDDQDRALDDVDDVGLAAGASSGRSG